MATQLHFLSHAPTAAQRAFRFPADEGISPLNKQSVSHLKETIGRYRTIWTSPERRSSETADALGFAATSDTELAAWSSGMWAGKTAAWVAEHDAKGFERWRRRPDAAPEGGESLNHLLNRVSDWMEAQVKTRGRALIIADASVIRAGAIHALGCGWETFWRMDISPLSLTMLNHSNGKWRLRTLNNTFSVKGP